MKSMDLKSWMARNRATGQALVDMGYLKLCEATKRPMFGCVGFHSLFLVGQNVVNYESAKVFACHASHARVTQSLQIKPLPK